MKTLKKTLVFVALICPFLATAQTKFTVQGQLTGLVDSKVTLHRYTLERGQSRDTAIVNNGKFTFNGNLDTAEPEIGQIIINNGKANSKSVVFYLEPGNIKINYVIGAAREKISGTPLNKDFQEYNDLLYAVLDSANAGRGAAAKFNQSSVELQDQVVRIIDRFAKKHPASVVSVNELNNMATYTKEISKSNQLKLNDIFQQLSPAIKNSKIGKEFASRVRGLSAAGVGKMAPLFSMPDTSGHVVSLTDFRGKYVLLDFWATWCIPCLEEMPNVANAYEKYKDKNFTVLAVSMDRPDSKAKWLSTIKKNNYTWPQVSDLRWWNCEAALLYNVNSAPSNFLIDPSGKIIATNLRGAELQSKLKEILN